MSLQRRRHTETLLYRPRPSDSSDSSDSRHINNSSASSDNIYTNDRDDYSGSRVISDSFGSSESNDISDGSAVVRIVRKLAVKIL
jgi:hypothetical protein